MTVLAAATHTTEPAASRRFRIMLRPGPRAPQIARRTLRIACADLPHRVVDDAALVVGELVTQSIRQVHGVVDVVVDVDPDGITVRVADAARTEPLTPDAPSATVRSWNVVRRLSVASGCRCDAEGREMWALLAPARVRQRRGRAESGGDPAS